MAALPEGSLLKSRSALALQKASKDKLRRKMKHEEKLREKGKLPEGEDFNQRLHNLNAVNKVDVFHQTAYC